MQEEIGEKLSNTPYVIRNNLMLGERYTSLTLGDRK